MQSKSVEQNHSKEKMFGIIFALAWPTMLEQLMQTAVQYIDTAMVGALGTEATAAVGSTTTINWLIGSTIHAVGIGFLAYISQNHGSGELEKVKRASAQAILAVLVLGCFFTAVTVLLSPFVPAMMQVDDSIRDLTATYFLIIYMPMIFRTASIILGTVLRAAGDTKTPMRVGILVNLVNVVLNYILIFPNRYYEWFGHRIAVYGADMGVVGAATASAISFAVGGICITITYLRHPIVTPKGYSIKPDWQILNPCLKVAIPNAFQRFGTSLGYVVFAAMVNSLGEVSTAAHTIANTVESAFYIPGYGMQAAAATLAGNAYGIGDTKKIRQLGKEISLIEVIMMICSGTLLFLFAPDMMHVFSKSEQVVALGTTVLRMVAISEPFYGVSIVLEGMLQGMGKTMMPFVCNIVGMWLIRIVGTFICISFLSMGLVSAWACMILHNLMLFFMFLLYYQSGKWDKNVK